MMVEKGILEKTTELKKHINEIKLWFKYFKILLLLGLVFLIVPLFYTNFYYENMSFNTGIWLLIGGSLLLSPIFLIPSFQFFLLYFSYNKNDSIEKKIFKTKVIGYSFLIVGIISLIYVYIICFLIFDIETFNVWIFFWFFSTGITCIVSSPMMIDVVKHNIEIIYSLEKEIMNHRVPKGRNLKELK
jgi:hypothetical protein